MKRHTPFTELAYRKNISKTYYELIDINKTILACQIAKEDIITEKYKMIAHYRKHRVKHLCKYLQINKRKNSYKLIDSKLEFKTQY